MQWVSGESNKVAEVISWLVFSGAEISQVLGPNGFTRLALGQLGSSVFVDDGDWIVQSPPGVFKAYKEVEFNLRYEAIA
jgi:hypothetical protein